MPGALDRRWRLVEADRSRARLSRADPRSGRARRLLSGRRGNYVLADMALRSQTHWRLPNALQLDAIRYTDKGERMLLGERRWRRNWAWPSLRRRRRPLLEFPRHGGIRDAISCVLAAHGWSWSSLLVASNERHEPCGAALYARARARRPVRREVVRSRPSRCDVALLQRRRRLVVVFGAAELAVRAVRASDLFA